MSFIGKWVKTDDYKFREKKYGYDIRPNIFEFVQVPEGTPGSFAAPFEMMNKKKYTLPDLPFDEIDLGYFLVDSEVIDLNAIPSIDSINALETYILETLNDYQRLGDKKWFFLAKGRLTKRQEGYAISVFNRLGTAPLVNCFINIVKGHISEEDYNRFADAKYLTKEEIQLLAIKNKFNVKFYDATHQLWHTTSSIRNIENSIKKYKTFHVMVNNEHCLSMVASVRYTISREEMENCSLKYFTKRGTLLRAYDLSGNNIEELRHIDDYFSNHQREDLDDQEYWQNLAENQLSLKQQYMEDLRSKLLPDNYYTENLSFYYLNHIKVNYGHTEEEQLYSYDSNRHFYRHSDCTYYKEYKFPCPPNCHINNTSDINLLKYSGFVYLNDFTILKTKILDHMLHKNTSYPSFFIKYLLDNNLIILTSFNISYNKSNLNIDINKWFLDKEFTPEIKKELYTQCYGMLKKSVIDSRLSYITIDSKDTNEIAQISNNDNFLFMNQVDNNQYKFYIKQSPHYMRRTYTSHWLYIIYYSICNTLDFYLTIPEENICDVYVDSIRTFKPVYDIPKNWRFEGYKTEKLNYTLNVKNNEIKLDEEKNPTYNLYFGIAGTGKSYNLLNNPPKNSIFVCPTHELIDAHKLNFPDLEFSTYHKFFNINTSYQHIRPTDYTNIILDEMGMISDELYINYIQPFMKAHPWIRIYFIYGTHQLGSNKSKMLPMLKSIPDINIQEFKTIHRIQDEKFKNLVYALHETDDIIDHIKLFSSRLININQLSNYYETGDITLISKHKLIDELNLKEYNPSTYHSVQGRTITTKIFIIVSEIFDVYMISMGITRLRDIENLYLVYSDKPLLTIWDGYLSTLNADEITELEEKEIKPEIKVTKKLMKQLRDMTLKSKMRYLKTKSLQDKLSMEDCAKTLAEHEIIYKAQLPKQKNIKQYPKGFTEYKNNKTNVDYVEKINKLFNDIK